jgi:hypothetical protein
MLTTWLQQVVQVIFCNLWRSPFEKDKDGLQNNIWETWSNRDKLEQPAQVTTYTSDHNDSSSFSQSTENIHFIAVS